MKRTFRRYAVFATQTIQNHQMIDNRKRLTLKIFVGASSLPLLSKIATASNSTDAIGVPVDSNLASANPDLDITFIEGSKPMIKVQNVTGKLAILRHIQPGTITVGRKSYDLNSSLLHSAYAIGAGKIRYIPVNEVGVSECSLCLSERYFNRPLRMASIQAERYKNRQLNISKLAFI